MDKVQEVMGRAIKGTSQLVEKLSTIDIDHVPVINALEAVTLAIGKLGTTAERTAGSLGATPGTTKIK